jgi:hypothetical protein
MPLVRSWSDRPMLCVLLAAAALCAGLATAPGDAMAADADAYVCRAELRNAEGISDYAGDAYFNSVSGSCSLKKDGSLSTSTTPLSMSLTSASLGDACRYSGCPGTYRSGPGGTAPAAAISISTASGAIVGTAALVMQEDTEDVSSGFQECERSYSDERMSGVVAMSGTRSGDQFAGGGSAALQMRSYLVVGAQYPDGWACMTQTILKLEFEIAGVDPSTPPPPPPCPSGQIGAGSNCVTPPPPPQPCPSGQIGVNSTCVTPPPPPDLTPAPPGAYSDKCTSPTAKVADGFAGGTYTRLRVQQVDADEAWVCFRVSNGGAVEYGGRVRVRAPGAGATAPTIDSSVGSCPSVLFSGQLGAPDNPPYVPIRAATASDSGSASVCITGGDLARRVRIALPTATTPDVSFDEDSPSVTDPASENGPLGFPSSRCDEASGGQHEELVNMDLASGHLWASFWQASATKLDICARAEGPLTAGGRLSVDATGTPGVSVSPQLSSDTSPCTATVVQVDEPAPFRIARSPNGAAAPSLCVEQGSTKRRVTIQVSGSPDPPDATWTDDPDSQVPVP